MALKLPDSAVPMGDFPVAKAVDIDFDDGENLQEKLDNGKLGSGGNTTDITDLENRVTTNETNITGLQEQIDNLDIPEDVDLTDIENRLTTLEENQLDVDITTTINNSSSNTQIPTAETVATLHNGKYLFEGTDVLRLNVGVYNITSDGIARACTNLPSASAGKLTIRSVQGDDGLTPYTSAYRYQVYEYMDIKGDYYVCTAINNTSTVSPDNVRVYGWYKVATSVDLTTVNTKLTQLETKANLIPVLADNPTEYDLNNYKENGNYSIGDSSKYSNVPTSRPALLTVIRSNSYRLQIYTVVNNDDVYFRKSTDWGSTWSSWVLLNGEVDLTSINSKLIQLENTINEVGGGGIYQSGEIEVGTWTGGQKLYRYTISDNTERTFSSGTGTGTMMLDFFTLSRNEYTVVKLDGTFRMCAAHDNSGAHTVYALPYVDLDTNRQVELVYTTMDKVRLSGTNLNNYKILGFDVSIYYYKK